jgi:DNA-binding MarR family transcriptional regulator
VIPASVLWRDPEGISATDWGLLRAVVATPGARPSDIAAALGLTRGAVSKAVDRLKARGALEQTVNAGDRRVQALWPSAAGQALADRLAPRLAAAEAGFFAGLHPAERVVLARALAGLAGRPDALR